MYLGIDLGTTAVKAIVVDETQKIMGEVTTEVTNVDRQPPISEQEPSTWIAAVESSLDTLSSKDPRLLAGIKSIGLSGHMHGAVLLDRNSDVLRPCIMWDDGRSTLECEKLEDAADFRGIAGNLVMAGFTAPKLRWIHKHEPSIFEKTRKILLPKDYLRLWMTGEFVSEMSDASGTLWMDIRNRDWSDKLLSACYLNRSHVPALEEGTAATGQLHKAHCRRWGIPQGAIVAGGAGDNAAAACGMGIVGKSSLISLGTSGVVFAPTKRFLPCPEQGVHAFCHAVPDLWHQMGVILSAASCLKWLSQLTCRTPASLVDLLPCAPAEPSKVLFNPCLTGSRTPYNDPTMRGSLAGLTANTDLPDVLQAVLEGVAFALNDCFQALKTAGTDIQEAFAVGGGSQSETWLKIIANATGANLLLAEKGEYGAAFGAARLAIVAHTNCDASEVMSSPPVKSEIVPDRDKLQSYKDAYCRFKEHCRSERASK